jgi:uncharacterized protein (TIGR02145 family)
VTFSATAPSGCTIDWYTTSSGGSLVSGTTTSYSPSLTATTTYYAQARNTTTGCVSATRLAVTATVNAVPIITRSGGAASQTVIQNAAITTITYTASNATSISRSGSTFPSNLSGTTSGLVHTISGAPAATGTFGYAITASHTNGCTSVASSGTITVTVPPTPPSAASTRTWTVGTQTWSDVINIPECNKTSFSASATTADCRSNGSYGYLYSWVYVANNASTLCPSPWRVPTSDDFCTLDKSLNNRTSCSNNRSGVYGSVYNTTWGGQYGGGCGGTGVLGYVGSMGHYWTSSADGTARAMALRYGVTLVTAQWSEVKENGFYVRCVK